MKKKIIIGLLAVSMAVGITGSLWGSSIAEAATGSWNSCPKGKVNDYYPGDCHDYIDSNKDKICDRSQPEPAAATTTPAVTAAVPAPATSIAPAAATAAAQSSGLDTGASNKTTSYYFLPVALVTLALYGLSWILSARKKLKTLTHRKIWNVVLAFTMAGSALLGLVRILIKDYNWDINLPFNVIFWHVEISIVLAVVALFHIIWHWRYFTRLLGTGKSKEA